jgi:hypothetical protein
MWERIPFLSNSKEDRNGILSRETSEEDGVG